METRKTIISSEAKLSAIAGMMFFAPFVKKRIKSDTLLSEEEKSFIGGYIQIGFVNLIFLGIVLIATLINVFFSNLILLWIAEIGSVIIFVISVFSTFTCVNDLPAWGENEPIKQNIPNKGQILKSYIPILNFILWFRQENYNVPYRRLKESIFFRTFFIFGTLLFGSSFGFWVLIAIAVRIFLLLVNVDIIPLSSKKIINSIFLCNPGEVSSYIFAPIVSKIKKSDYRTVLQAKKLGYMQGQKLGIGIIVQYILFGGILFLLYRGIDISLENIVLFIAMIFGCARVVLFYVYKKMLLKIPILSEIVSLVFS